MLLFQFRVIIDQQSSMMRTCEKRLILLAADTAKAALALAKKRGKDSEFRYQNNDGNPVYFEFIGVLDLLCIGDECEEDEVWYDIMTLKQPKERAKSLLPAESQLHAIQEEKTSLNRSPTRSRRKNKSD